MRLGILNSAVGSKCRFMQPLSLRKGLASTQKIILFEKCRFNKKKILETFD